MIEDMTVKYIQSDSSTLSNKTLAVYISPDRWLKAPTY